MSFLVVDDEEERIGDISMIAFDRFNGIYLLISSYKVNLKIAMIQFGAFYCNTLYRNSMTFMIFSVFRRVNVPFRGSVYCYLVMQKRVCDKKYRCVHSSCFLDRYFARRIYRIISNVSFLILINYFCLHFISENLLMRLYYDAKMNRKE